MFKKTFVLFMALFGHLNAFSPQDTVIAVDWHDVMSPWFPVKLDQDMLELVRTLKAAGYTVIVASNMGAQERTKLIKKYPCLATDFDYFFIQDNNNAYTKNDAQYFKNLKKLVQQKFGKSHIVFIDNKKKNIKKAQQHTSITGIHFKDVPQTAIAIKQLGVL